MRSVIVLSLAGSFALCGCSGTRPTASRPSTVASAPSARAVADPAVPASRPSPPPRTAPASRAIPMARGLPRTDPLSREAWSRALGPDDTVVLDRSLRSLRVDISVGSKKSDFWSPCVRDFVQLQPETARDALGEALSLYGTSCTSAPARRVEFQTPPAGRTTSAQSYLGLVGALQRTSSELALRAAFHGEPVHAERITLIADGIRWSSPRIDFDDDDGWEVATLPLTRELVRVVKRAADARDTLLRFEAARSYEDVIITEDMKQDLRVMLDALDAINRP